MISYINSKGNVVIVDTPGIGDTDQNEVANKMMDYLPNALAFVFVINVAAAGGIQKDRVFNSLFLFFANKKKYYNADIENP